MREKKVKKCTQQSNKITAKIGDKRKRKERQQTPTKKNDRKSYKKDNKKQIQKKATKSNAVVKGDQKKYK